MSVNLLTEQNMEFLSLKKGYTGSSESTCVKMPHSWRVHVAVDTCISNAILKLEASIVII